MSTPQLWKCFSLHWKLFPFNKYYPVIFDIKISRLVINNPKAARRWWPNLFLLALFTLIIPSILIFYFGVPNTTERNPRFLIFCMVFLELGGILTTFLHLV